MKKLNIYSRIGRRWQADLFNMDFKNASFNFGQNDLKVNKHKIPSLLSKFKSKFQNNLHYVLWNNCSNKKIADIEKYDLIMSHQKFFVTNKPYFIHLENGLALIDYNFSNFNIINKYRIKKEVEKTNFKGFAFYSETSRKSYYALWKDVFDVKKYDLGVLPIFTYDNPLITENFIEKKYSDFEKRKTKAMFAAAEFVLKGGVELFYAVESLQKDVNIEIEFITSLKTIPISILEKLRTSDFVKLTEFNLPQREFYKKLMDADFIVHPTFFDSHSIVLIEALKNALPIITTDTFANREYIYGNGYLILNPYNTYDENYFPTDKRHHEVIISDIKVKKNISDNMIIEIENHIRSIIKDLNSFSKNSFLLGTNYSNKVIQKSLNEIVLRMMKN